MQVYDIQVLKTKFADTRVKVDAYFARRTALLPNQTTLKLGDYNLIGAPAFLSMDEAHLLVVLSPQEVTLFSKFMSVTNTLILEFDNPEAKDVLRFIVRVSLMSIDNLPNRKNICMINLKFKSVPAEYIRILGTYLEEQEGRRADYESRADQFIELTDEATRLTGYNSYCELLHGEVKNKVQLKALSTKFAKIVLAGGAEQLVGQTPLHLKLYFRTGPFAVEAHFAEGTAPQPGEASVELGFSNDLMTIYEDYQFKLSLQAKKKAAEEA